ncbi:MAG TPA: SDR family NAD(P)-dependent oxidoreductase [Solirubrobacteraceae bacterium]|jgi:short-subunit dehydrogenase|nr:SDR family NAD(P)-dependent oxidoreductase [Solirubrobacteraceae bacterium]
MKNLQGRTALVTGASGGLGTHIARRLAQEGMNVAVSGRREDALAEVAAELSTLGVKSAAVPADLSDLTQLDTLVDGVESVLGSIDVLVNNAGVEAIGAFTTYTREELTSMVDVNLTAPLLLTHRLTPGMLERERGHVVFIASVAGKVGPAFNEPYAATKAGLLGLTQSLRAEYLHAPVGFSVVCPGFIAGDGMYARMAEEGHRSNRMMGETTTEKIAKAVVRAIRDDRAEILESGAPLRPMLALAQLAPGLLERVAPRFGVTELFRSVAAARGRLD